VAQAEAEAVEAAGAVEVVEAEAVVGAEGVVAGVAEAALPLWSPSTRRLRCRTTPPC
jgi:hypothetical protein